jgi:hypothetical protein
MISSKPINLSNRLLLYLLPFLNKKVIKDLIPIKVYMLTRNRKLFIAEKTYF